MTKTPCIVMADAFVRSDPPPAGPFRIVATHDGYTLAVYDGHSPIPVLQIPNLPNAAALAEALASQLRTYAFPVPA